MKGKGSLIISLMLLVLSLVLYLVSGEKFSVLGYGLLFTGFASVTYLEYFSRGKSRRKGVVLSVMTVGFTVSLYTLMTEVFLYLIDGRIRAALALLLHHVISRAL
ncbi:hypothetical protein [Halobacillus litoralis]|uniref:hypothetical protein n=1 Tax=Halobacillus litoralis TaxID=45668 RepID=UPI001CFEBE22|nr:hypothetical protein [Halobacillus litoralis]